MKMKASMEGGRGEDTCDHGLSGTNVAESKTTYESSWKVQVMIEYYKYVNINAVIVCFVRPLRASLNPRKGLSLLLTITVSREIFYIAHMYVSRIVCCCLCLLVCFAHCFFFCRLTCYEGLNRQYLEAL